MNTRLAALAACTLAAGLAVAAMPLLGGPQSPPGQPAPAPRDIPRPVGLQSINVANQSRSYYLYVPSTCDASRPAPVVFVLHGRGSNGAQLQRYIKMNAQAARHGFIVVYPNAVGDPTMWNVGFETFNVRGLPDDVEFIRALLEKLKGDYPIDADRVYATGHSAGGFMCHRLAVEMPGTFAAIAPVAGAIGVQVAGKSICVPQPKQPVSVLAIHGTADNLVPYDGGGPFRVISAPQSTSFWVKHNQCPDRPEEKPSDDGQFVVQRYAGGKDGVEVVLITVKGYGHGWPGAWLYTPSRESLDATAVIWEFFASHSRPRPAATIAPTSQPATQPAEVPQETIEAAAKVPA